MRTAALVIVLAAALSAPAAAAAPSRLFVSATEWSLVLSRQAVAAGPARVQLHNAGEDAHDLRLRRIGGRSRTLRIDEARPGQLGELRARLTRGRWRLWCSLPGHARAGMRATLRVR